MLNFSKEILYINCEMEKERICNFVKKNCEEMKRDGIIVGLSGGIDSAVTAALCVEAIGKDRVLGVILPEKDSNPVSVQYAEKEAERLGIKTKKIDITPTLKAFGTYMLRDKIIKSIFPDFIEDYTFKITLPPDLLEKDRFNYFTLTVEDKEGKKKSKRLKKDELNGIVSATDTKQRMRMMHLYYFAEANNFLVCGTTNKSEVLQGFFVKYGDGGVDIEPLAHLYKVQVYQLANYLGIIEEIVKRKPSPDTFTSNVSDEEFYFRIAYDQLDLLLFAWENNISISDVCREMNLDKNQVNRAFRDFQSKYNATKHLRQLPPSMT